MDEKQLQRPAGSARDDVFADQEGGPGSKSPPIPPGTKVSTATTVEEAIRILENGPTEGIVVLDVNVFREASKAFLRRHRGEGAEPSGRTPPRFTPEHLNTLFGDLTHTEQTFLLTLLREPGAFVSREELFRAIRGGEGKESHRTHALNQTACVLRKKLGPDGAGRCIETVRSIGFRWNRENEPESLSFNFFKVAGLAMLSTFVVAAGVLRFAHQGHDAPDVAGPFSATDGNALVSDEARLGASGSDDPVPSAPYQAIMRIFDKSGSLEDPTASVAFAKGHSPWRMLDGLESTWFEGASPARAGDWLAFRFPIPLERSAGPDRGRRIEILLGRPDSSGPPLAPPCRVECSSDPFGASDAWFPLGDVDPATGRCALDLSNMPLPSVAAVRVVVTADSPLPLAVREARLTVRDSE